MPSTNGTPTLNDESVPVATPPITHRTRNKRARIEVDDDDVILTNGKGH